MYRGYLAVPLDLMKTKNLENIDAFEKSNAGFDFSWIYLRYDMQRIMPQMYELKWNHGFMKCWAKKS